MYSKVFWRSSLYLLLALISLELAARYFGLHDYPLYIESNGFEYFQAANQDRLIYRNHYITNSYGMRSAEVTKDDTTVVLLIGDSVINGGNLTDHRDLASTILEVKVSELLKHPVRILNISANSWGPENARAYIEITFTIMSMASSILPKT